MIEGSGSGSRRPKKTGGSGFGSGFATLPESFAKSWQHCRAQGVEGVFRASCERSLAVLRANKEALLTVLEVMLHDPLYNWSVGPGKAAAKQAGEWKKLCDEDGGQKNKGNRQVSLFT
jgi:hypothetical protein